MAVMMTSRLPIVSTTNAAGFPEPSGTKLSTSRCFAPSIPNFCNTNDPSEEQYPVLLYNDYVYWPLSYKDDRFSFAIVRTSGTSAGPLDTLELKGARYIDSIDVAPGNKSVSFIGEGHKVVSVPWNDLAASENISTSPLQPSIISSAPFLATSGFEDELEVSGIVGVIIGSVLGVMVTVAGGYLYWRMRRKKSRVLSLTDARRYPEEDLENGESNLGDRASLFGCNTNERSSPATESHSPFVVSNFRNTARIVDYGTIHSSRTSPTRIRQNTWNPIGDNPPGFGLGEPGEPGDLASE